MQKKLIKYISLAILVVAGVLWYLLSSETSPEGAENEVTFDFQKDSEIPGKWTETDETFLETTLRFVMVHVCGEVVNPGVYELFEGARVIQAIDAAGGTTEAAVADYLNLARVVNDGDKIYVPSVQEVQSGMFENEGVAGDKDSLSVNINTATKEELMKLPGIGESKAESIIAYRNENGNFSTVEDIMLIGGIKEAMFNRIKDYIKVYN